MGGHRTAAAIGSGRQPGGHFLGEGGPYLPAIGPARPTAVAMSSRPGRGGGGGGGWAAGDGIAISNVA